MMKTPDIIIRSSYLDLVSPYIGKPIIKVFTGQRRTGKSFLMLQTMEEIRKLFPDQEVIYINKEHPDFDRIKDSDDLWAFISQNKKLPGKCFIFIDEVQEIKDFEKSLRGLLADGSFDVYCTGSNATLLSGELATLLSGRYIEIPVHSLSYTEFIRFHRLENTSDNLLKYMMQGGMPFLIHLDDDNMVRREYLRNVLNTILFRDVAQRFNVRNISFLTNLVTFLADNTGSLVSANRIADFLRSQKISVSVRTIIDYLFFLESSYLIHKVGRYDITGRRLFEVNDKYYFEDLGLQHALKPYDPKNLNKYLESLVFRHLVGSGFKAYVGKLGEREIDFVATRDDQRIYVQASLNVQDPKTFEREFGNLLQIKDNHPKYVVTLDEYASGNHKGINLMNVRDFLTNNLID